MLRKNALKFPLLLLSVAIAFILLHSPMTWGLTPPETVRQMSVQINGNKQGTGVIIGKEGNIYTVLTTCRVVDPNYPLNVGSPQFANYQPQPQGDYKIRTYEGQDYQINASKKAKCDAQADIALIEFSSEKSYPVAKIGDSGQLPLGTPIYVYGWTEGKGKRQERYEQGIIRGIQPKARKGYQIVHNVETAPGMSGGAIFDQEGNLVGIHGLIFQEDNTSIAEFYGIPITVYQNWQSRGFEVARGTVSEDVEKPESVPVQDSVDWNKPLNYVLAYTLENDTGLYNDIALSPDGEWLARGSNDKTIKLWDLKTGHLERTFTGHSDTVSRVKFSPDGKRLASVSRDETIKLWNLKTGQLEPIFTDNNYVDDTYVYVNVKFSADGQWLASRIGDKTIKLWNLKTGQLEQTFTCHYDYFSSLEFSFDGQWLAIGNQDETSDLIIELWHLKTEQLERTLTGAYGHFGSVAFSPDGQWLAGVSYTETYLWNLKTGDLEYTFQSASSNVSFDEITFSPDGELLIIYANDSYNVNILGEIWNLTTRELQCTVPQARQLVKFSRDGYKAIILAAIIDQEAIKIWNIENCQLENQAKLIGFNPATDYSGYSNAHISNNFNILAIDDDYTNKIYIFKLNQ